MQSYQKLMKATGAQRLVLTDEPCYAVPTSVYKQLTAFPGYERALFLAAALSKIAPTDLLVTLPPFPNEMEIAKKIHQKLGKYPLRVFATHPTLTEIYNISGSNYVKLVKKTLSSQNPNGNAEPLLFVLKKRVSIARSSGL